MVKYSFPLFIAVCAFLASACSTSTEKHSMDSIVNNYFGVKDAFYNNDSKAVTAAAGNMKSAVDNLDLHNMKAEEADEWRKVSKDIDKSLDAISSATDIQQQRINFAGLSSIMVEEVKKLGHGDKMYIQHCPMAKTEKGEGADWISQREKIENPYFGAKSDMAGCGETKESL